MTNFSGFAALFAAAAISFLATSPAAAQGTMNPMPKPTNGSCPSGWTDYASEAKKSGDLSSGKGNTCYPKRVGAKPAYLPSPSSKQLGLTNSRLAARMLASFEGDTPIYKGPNEIGIAIPGRHQPKTSSTLTRFRLKFEGGFIMAEAPPIVVSTSPADGSIIAPGPFDLTVTFDRAMLEGSYSFVQVSPETFPDCTPVATLSADGMSYTMLCTATAGREYEVWFNRPPYMNFKSIDGISAQPHRIRFRSE